MSDEANKRNTKPYNVSIIVTSDTCSQDESQDASGAYVVSQLREMPELFTSVSKLCVPDDQEVICNSIIDEINRNDPALLITIGGTGMCPRDVTPEACNKLYDKQCGGIVAALHMASLRYSPHAALSRLTSGILGETLIINFPGSLKACKDCLSCMLGFIEHALEQVRFNAGAYKSTHDKIKATLPVLVNSATKPSPVAKPQQANGPTGQPNAQRAFNVRPKAPQHNQQTPTRARSETPNHPHSRMSSKSSVKTTTSVRNNKNNNYNKNKNNTNNPNLKTPLAMRNPDLRSSRLSIKEVLESRITDPLAVDGSSERVAAEHKSRRELTESIATTLAKSLGTPTKVKPMINRSKYQQISHKNALTIMGSLTSEVTSQHEIFSLSNFSKAYQCIGAVLAQDLKPKCIIPAQSVSTMDGYVIHVPIGFKNMINQIKSLPPVRVVGSFEEFSEDQNDSLKSQSFFCYQVNTGGRLPERNFAVIPVEKTSPITEDIINVHEVRQGCYVRKAGSDLAATDILSRGTVIGPVELGLIMAMQHRDFVIAKRPTLGFLSTGDELIDFFANKDTDENTVIDTNGPLLTSLFRSEGYRSNNFGIVRDDPNALLASITESLQKCDILIITGGASMGSKDHVKDVIESIDGQIHFGRINIKPGKPASLASVRIGDQRKFIFSLPGNPVSAYVTSLVLVKPFLNHALRQKFSPQYPMSLDCVGDLVEVVITKFLDTLVPNYTFEDRLEFVRATITGRKDENDRNSPYLVSVSMRQQSSCMLSLKDCNCLIMIDPMLKGSKFEIGQVYPALKLHKSS